MDHTDHSNIKDKNDLIPAKPRDVAVYDIQIKVENDPSVDQAVIKTEDTSDNDTANRQSFPQYVAINEIKIEYDFGDTEKHNNIEHNTNSEMACGSTVNKNVVTDTVQFKVFQEMITPKVFTNIGMEHRSMLPSDVVVKVESCDEMHQDGTSGSATNAGVKLEGVLVGEDYSVDGSLPSAQTSQKAQMSTKGVKQVTKVPNDSPQVEIDTRQQLAANGGLIANDKFYDIICPYLTNNEVQLMRLCVKTKFAVDTSAPSVEQYLDKVINEARNSNKKQFDVTNNVRGDSNTKACRSDASNKAIDNIPKVTELLNTLKPSSPDLCNPKKTTQRCEKPFSCKICHKKFKYQKDVKRHAKTHSSERPFSCEVCHKSFKDEKYVAKHTQKHLCEQVLTCEVCHKKYNYKRSLDNHMMIHSGQRSVSCEVCHKTFSQKRDLTAHRKTHSDNRPFSCNVCFKAFKVKCHLKSHIKTHSLEKPFSCEICHKTFGQKKSLLPHMRSHTGEKPYSCVVCQKPFGYRGSLIYHMKIHSWDKPFSCDICHKTFKHKGNLAYHIRTHSDEKEFSCEVCHKTFGHKRRLTCHKRIHLREKSYSCDTCDKAFDEKCHLVDHMNIHSGEKHHLTSHNMSTHSDKITSTETK